MTSFLIVALLFAQQAAPPEKCTLSGTVVDSVTGLPLGKVDVVAESSADRDADAATTSDAKGNFAMIDVEPGQYRISARRNGYLDTYYGAKRPSSSGSTFNLTAGQKLNDLRIKMAPFGVIAGTVRDSDGEPLASAFVSAYRLEKSPGGVENRMQLARRSVQTDDLGQYRVSDLLPGKYYLSAVWINGRGGPKPADHSVKTPEPPELPVTTFYPGTPDPSIARPVELIVGSRVTGVDITIIRSRMYKVSAHIDVPQGLRASVHLDYSMDGLGGFGDIGDANAKGDVEVRRVPPGSYKLQLWLNEPDKSEDAVYDPTQLHLFCATNIPITVEDHDTEGLRLTAVGCAIAEGHVAVEGVDKPALGASEVDFDHGRRNATLKADGSFITSLEPGARDIDLSRITREHPFYVKSIRSGSQDILRSGFTASPSERIDLEVLLGSDGGSVEGIVSDADDKSVTGATVVLIPNDPVLRTRFDFVKDVVTDQAGHFELKSIAPGGYKLFAWDDIEPGSWFDPDVLRSVEAKGEVVTVKPKDSATANLRLIP